jgi:carbamoyl-phosphate synthase large subunit
MSKQNILITGGGGPSTEALQSLWANNYVMYFADADINRIIPNVPNEMKIEIPWANAKNFITEMKKIIIEKKIDVLISQVDEELLTLAEIEREGSTCSFIIPDREFIDGFLDKYAASSSIKNKLNADPNTRLLESTAQIESKNLIIKPRKGRGSRDLFFSKNESELEGLKKYLSSKYDSFITQDFVDGEEYSVQVINNLNGRIKAIVPIKIYEKRGSTTHGVVENNPIVIKFCEEFQAAFSTKGTYNIQLIVERKSQKIFVFEVNPRVSTTMCVAVYAGIDPIKLYFETNGANKIVLAPNGVEIRRYWKNVFSKNHGE